MTLNDLLLHPHTHRALTKFTQKPRHGYIFHGVEGVGKFTAAMTSIAQRHPNKRHLILENNWEYLHVIRPPKDKKSIGIDQIKHIDTFIQLAHSHDTYIVIDDANKLTLEAQNAFLKTLEEPPGHIHIILITHDSTKIVSTIHSRTHHVSFLAPPRDDIQKYLDHLSVESDASKLILNISQAIPGKAITLAKDKEALSSAETRLSEAKLLLSAPLTERLLLINKLNKDRTLEVLEYMKLMAQAALQATANKYDTEKVAQWSRKAEAVLDAIEDLQKNANQRLVMTNLVLNL